MATTISVIAAVAAFALSPLGLLIGAIAAAVFAWAKFTESGQAARDLFGEIIADIGTRLLQGDLAGAWDTVVKGMASAWDAFSLGVLEVFHAVVDSVAALWNDLMNSVKGSLVFMEAALRATGQESAANAVASVRSGVGVVAGAGTAALGVTAAGVVSAENVARDKANQSAREFAGHIAGGSERLSEELQSIIDQFKNLGAGGKLQLPGAAELAKAATTVTFSGSALLAAGQGGGPQREMLKLARDTKELNKKQLKKNEELVTLTERSLKFV
jgi:hypothetical protein